MNWLFRWFKPGIGLKRWVVPIGIGAFFLGVGLFPFRQIIVPGFVRNYIGTFSLLILGVVLLGVGIFGLIYAVASSTHHGHRSLYHQLRRSRRLRSGPRVSALGGGTGLSTILRGLKHYTSNLTAIVAVTDDGGSSGRLREQFNLPAPGDLRNCLVALAPEEERLSKLFSYRFTEGDDLEGHTIGNLLLTALTDITGGFDAALRECSDVLATEGRVLPSMLGTPELWARLENGDERVGETEIGSSEQSIRQLSVRSENSSSNPEAVAAISASDAIVVGPGSLYTSILSNFIEPELCSAIIHSPADRFYICNLMTEAGETEGFSVKDHLDAFQEIPPFPVFFDHVIVNIRQAPASIREEYEKEGAEFVRYDFDQLRDYPGQIHTGDFLRIEDGVLRHDVKKVCQTIEEIVESQDETGP